MTVNDRQIEIINRDQISDQDKWNLQDLFKSEQEWQEKKNHSGTTIIPPE